MTVAAAADAEGRDADTVVPLVQRPAGLLSSKPSGRDTWLQSWSPSLLWPQIVGAGEPADPSPEASYDLLASYTG